MSRTLVTGGSGFIGSHVARALAARGDELRLLLRRGARTEHLADLSYERVTGDITDRRAVRRAVKGADRVFHVAGTTSLRVRDHDRVFAINLGGTRNVLEAALDSGVERVVHTSSVAAIGPAPEGKTADETQPFTAGELGIAYVNSKHEAEVEALRFAARGLDVVCVNPTFVLGPDAPSLSSMGLVRRFLMRQIPVYTDGALNIVDVRDIAAGHLLADEKGASGERYILGGRNFTLQRLFADLARISGASPPALRLPAPMAIGGSGPRPPDRHPAPGLARGGPLGHPVVDLPVDQGEPRAGLRGEAARGDPRGRRPLAALGARRPGLARRRPARRPAAGGRPRPGGGGAPDRSMSEVVLYRCRTPTNVLCPCGAVARRLRKLGIDHRTERVAQRRSERPEIVELTRQNRVPVLVDGEEVVHDSKRILPVPRIRPRGQVQQGGGRRL